MEFQLTERKNAAKSGKRLYSDRRKSPTPVFSRYTLFGGSRKTIRRVKDRKKHLFVDLYSTRLAILIMGILILSCLDALLTLSLMADGKAFEANPVMVYFMSLGTLQFTVGKFLITAIALIILCVSKNIRIARIGLPVALKIYLLIVGYEVYLISV